jgi:hypothetical protein
MAAPLASAAIGKPYHEGVVVDRAGQIGLRTGVPSAKILVFGAALVSEVDSSPTGSMREVKLVIEGVIERAMDGGLDWDGQAVDFSGCTQDQLLFVAFSLLWTYRKHTLVPVWIEGGVIDPELSKMAADRLPDLDWDGVVRSWNDV